MAFDPDLFSETAGLPFRSVLLCLVGANSTSDTPVLSSLFSELIFNDCRDAERRHSKKEQATMAQCHAVATKSVAKRAQTQTPITLSDCDWAARLPGKAIKAQVFCAGRLSDSQLGLDTEGLLRKRFNPSYTKPHVLNQRLCLMRRMVQKYKAAKEAGTADQFNVSAEISKMWVNDIPMPDFFIKTKGEADTDTRMLILGQGPYTQICYKLERSGDAFCPPKLFGIENFVEWSLDDFNGVLLASTEPCLCGPQMGWKMKSDWMPLEKCVCEYKLHIISVALLSSVCQALKLRGYSKLSHPLRCELLLNHCQYDEAFIQEALLLIPDRSKRRKKEDWLTGSGGVHCLFAVGWNGEVR